jgi:DNA helicase-2/ATP-dependent DNA helicase PcrA
MTNTDKFKDLGVELPVVEKCFERYEAAKKLKRKYDYCDMLIKVYNLLSTDEDAKHMVQRYYDYVIVDEVQDFTPIMWKLLQLFVDDGTPLTCIGDEDQLIYYFRGASIQELLHFENNFSGGRVYTLTQNRRCRKKILDEALFAVSENTLRFDKSLIGTKDGGSVELIPYNSLDGQIINVVERLKKMTPDEQRDSVICFREQMCSQLLAEMLEENNVPYNSLQNVLPMSHELYRHVIDVLGALEMPYDREASIQLYKVLPCKKSEIFKIFGYDAEHHKFSTEETHRHFAEYDYGRLMQMSGFAEAMQRLIEISSIITTAPMSSYFGDVYKMLCKYFWNFKKSQKAMKVSDDYDDLFEERVKRFFSSSQTFGDFLDEYSKRMSICRNNNASKAGVTISTFHGLKGLEFKHVYVVFLDDRIFPNFPLIRSRQYPQNIELELKESETRLWYVVLTRAIDDLHLYYSKSNPSYYVQRILDRDSKSEAKEPEKKKIESMAAFDDFDFENDFDDDFEDEVEEPVAAEQSEEAVVVEKSEEPVVAKKLEEPVVAETTEEVAGEKNMSVGVVGLGKNSFLQKLIDTL